MNPAAEARAKVKATHPEAVVVERGRNSIKHQIDDAPDGRQRFVLDVAIGPFHYGDDQEIDTALVPSTAPWDWEMTKAGFEVRALSTLSAGQVIEYRSSEWVRFQPMALQYSNDLNQIQQISMPQAVDATVDDDTLTWTGGYGPGRSLSWQVQTARLAKLLTIDTLADLPAVDQFILDGGNPVLELNLIFAFSAGVTPYINGQPWGKGQVQDADTQGLVEFRDDQGEILWWFNLPRSWDTEGNEQLGTFRLKKQGNSLYVSHRVPLSFVQGAVYPLYVDVTVDDQVAANSDDMYEIESSTVVTDHASIQTGLDDDTNPALRYWPGFRWDSPTGSWPSLGDTVDVAYVEAYFHINTADDPYFHIYAEDAAGPPTFVAENANISNRTATTAKVDWQSDSVAPSAAWVQTPSLVGIFQELVDDYNITTVVIIWKSGTSGGTHADKFYYTRPYNFDSSLSAKLHIEYTAAGVTTRRYSLPLTGVG